DALVVVNPNNPDGRRFAPDALAARAADGRFTLIDESFADPTPEASAVPWSGGEGLLVLKSFGKFFGLAGLRLGFVIGSARDIEGIGDRLGPWAVSGPALEIGRAALADAAWIAETRARLARDGARLDAWSAAMGWGMVGGADLFRLVDTPDAAAAQGRLAEARIWTRAFPYSGTWLRIGLPQPDAWPRLEALVP
ncbi:MAG: aminotransferase class I/II-fold pyridoxal phosphate-dependent enzyme, partial [Pseudomonadota bacterium]